MDTLTFGTMPTLYALAYPPGFTIVEGDFYDPETGVATATPTATQYQTAFLVPLDDYEAIKEELEEAIATFKETGEVNLSTVVIDSDDISPSKPGSYSVFWLSATYDRFEDQVLITLEGYGEPEQTTIFPGQSFSVSELAAIGSVVGVIKGFKPGLGLESRPDVPFSYDATSGVLSVSSALDYETSAEWALTIGGQEVTIWVLDEEEAPTPSQSTYVFYLDPETAPGTTLGTVSANQAGNTGTLPTYSIVSGNTGGYAIDSSTGEIVYLGGEGLEDGLVLGVSYGGEAPLTVTLRVLPPNTVTLPIRRFNLPATLSDGMLVGTVGDTGVQASLTHEGFQVVDNSLYVQDKSLVEPGLTELTLNLKAQGRTGEQTVYINVAEFPAINEFWVAEDSSNGSTIGTVELPGGGVYTLTPTTLFNVNSGTGEILVTNASLLTPGTYTLTVSRGGSSASVTVKVYEVLTTNSLDLTVAPSTPSGTAVGTVQGEAPFDVAVDISPYTLNADTGVITLTTAPAIALTFEVTDAALDTVTVSISLDAATTGATGFIGAVYPGQTGQVVATKVGVLFSLASVGFGQGTLSVNPDNLGSVTRNTAGKVVASKASGIQLTLSARATPAMVTALATLWAAPLETPHTVAVPGENFTCTLTNFQRSYDAEGVSVTLDLRT